MLVDVRGCYVTSYSESFVFREHDVIGYDVGRTGQCLKHLNFVGEVKIIVGFI